MRLKADDDVVAVRFASILEQRRYGYQQVFVGAAGNDTAETAAFAVAIVPPKLMTTIKDRLGSFPDISVTIIVFRHGP
ncbi:MAG: hypothetical protein ABJN26_04345 [Stappiaceae bacterium]